MLKVFLKAYPSHVNKSGHEIIPIGTELKPKTQPLLASPSLHVCATTQLP
jgi:hypothetical protein